MLIYSFIYIYIHTYTYTHVYIYIYRYRYRLEVLVWRYVYHRWIHGPHCSHIPNRFPQWVRFGGQQQETLDICKSSLSLQIACVFGSCIKVAAGAAWHFQTDSSPIEIRFKLPCSDLCARLPVVLGPDRKGLKSLLANQRFCKVLESIQALSSYSRDHIT